MNPSASANIAGISAVPSSMPTFLAMAAREPFRLFFPAATLAGIVGIALWPLHLLGIMAFYPGQIHAHIMAFGMFGGFIFGFLGTAMPRMLSVPPLRGLETGSLLAVHLSMVCAYALGNVRTGNILFLALLILFVACICLRIPERKDLPPPGFILVALSLASAGGGAALGLVQITEETSPLISNLQNLLSYQGFVLFPILGIGPFILPRFFGQVSPHDLPESRRPARPWISKAFLAFTTGAIILWSFYLEAEGFFRFSYGLRFVAAAGYMILEFPFRTGPKAANTFGAAIRISMLAILSGFLAITFFPAYRVSLLHLTLVGGFAIITFTVATRVLFGHSGNISQLQKRSWWFLIAVGMMLFGMATRISGDFWPKITASHYIYGAILWIAGATLWSIFALPKILQADDEK